MACAPPRNGKSAAAHQRKECLKRTKPGFLYWIRSLILSAPVASPPMSDTPEIPERAPNRATTSTSKRQVRDIAAPGPAYCPSWEMARRFPAQEKRESLPPE